MSESWRKKGFILAAIGAICLPAFAFADCAPADFQVTITKWRWADNCRTKSCPLLFGTGVLTNRCASAAGAQVRITGYDAQGTPIATRETWPFSVRDVPPGVHPFSIDQWLDPDPDIKSLQVEVVEVKIWK